MQKFLPARTSYGACHVPWLKQRGVAAIEFAFVAIALLGCLHLIATFGIVLYNQQVLSRAAADGAMAISSSSRNYQQDAIKEVVFTSVARSLVVPPDAAGGEGEYAGRLAWVRQQIQIDFATQSVGGLPGIELRIAYPYAANAVLPSFLPLNFIIPDLLRARAIVAIGS